MPQEYQEPIISTYPHFWLVNDAIFIKVNVLLEKSSWLDNLLYQQTQAINYILYHLQHSKKPL